MISRRVISYDVVRESIVIVVAMFLLAALVYGLIVGVEPRTATLSEHSSSA